MNDMPTIPVEVNPSSKAKNTVFRVVAILFVVALTIYLLSISNKISEFAEEIPGLGWFAYPAIFGLSIVANATVIIPVPGVMLTSLFGSVFNPIGVALAAGLGASLGELSGYLAGYGGQGVIERSKWRDRLYGWMQKYGNWTILILAFIPNPLFDMAGMTAGALKIKLPRFLLWCALGKILKMLMFAYAGTWLSSLF